MAIYELGDFITFKRGEKDDGFKKEKSYYYSYPIISAGINIKGYLNKFNTEPFIPSISSSGANAGFITIPREKYFAADCFTLTVNNNLLIFQKYFNYWLLTKQEFIKKEAKGSAQPHVYSKDIKNIKIVVPSLKEQQKIIDIIEPLDIFINELLETQKCIIKIFKLLTNQKFEVTDKFLKDMVSYKKDKIKEFKTEGTPFIDIRMLNSGKVTKYVDAKPNVQIGDILLSLDATLGIVKYNLEGYNGYAFKVESDSISNLEIYLNLISDLNQEIIKNNSIGTTIKHASKAKEKMLYIKMPEWLKTKSNLIFDFLVNIEKQLIVLNKLKDYEIKLLIK